MALSTDEGMGKAVLGLPMYLTVKRTGHRLPLKLNFWQRKLIDNQNDCKEETKTGFGVKRGE